jgi:hypothetical protein
MQQTSKIEYFRSHDIKEINDLGYVLILLRKLSRFVEEG